MRWLNALLASRESLEAEEGRASVAGIEAERISDVRVRTRTTVAGTVVALTYSPRDAISSVTARLFDGTGTIGLRFVGRESIPGIETGRRLVASGMVADRDGQPVIYNPVYRLLPGAS